MKADAPAANKILHIINGFGPGGVETWLVECVKYLTRHPETNIQFDFLLTGGKELLFDHQVRDMGCKTFYVKYSTTSLGKFRKQLRRILSENPYHAIHDHEDFISGWHYFLGGKRLPSIRISHVHNPYNFVHNYVVNPLRFISFRVGRKLMARLATDITGTSDAVMNEYGYNKPPFARKRKLPAYCGFDTSRFRFDNRSKTALCAELGWDVSVKICLFAGRIGLQDYDTAANQKNPHFAFEVAKELVSDHPQWRFLFVGYKGETGQMMEAHIREVQMSDRIKFLGVRHDMPKIMSASNILLFPSLWEGLGMVAVEAQCSGMKVIMSDTIPVEAIVCDNLVVRKRLEDGPSTWMKAINATTADYDRNMYAEIVSQSPFSINNSVLRLKSLYQIP